MKMIRVCRSERISQSNNDLVIYGEWVDATPEKVLDCDFIAKAGNEMFGSGTHWIESHEVPVGQDHPDAAIERLITESIHAWTDGDIETHTACFTPGAVFISPAGSCFRGHDGLNRAFASERAAMPGLQINPEKIQITYPSLDTGVILMEGTVRHSGQQLPQRWASTQVAVLTSSNDWRFASLQVFHVR